MEIADEASARRDVVSVERGLEDLESTRRTYSSPRARGSSSVEKDLRVKQSSEGAKRMRTKIVVGQHAPSFALPDTDRKVRRIEDFRDKKVVLAFYPGAFTSVCTKEMCTFRDSMAKFNALDAQVIGVSVNDPWSNGGFAEVDGLRFPLLSDYNREVIRTYGVEATDFGGLKGYTVAKRSVFIMDREGIVRYVWVSEDPRKEPDYEEIEKALEKIK